jgi:hypothetical protein
VSPGILRSVVDRTDLRALRTDLLDVEGSLYNYPADPAILDLPKDLFVVEVVIVIVGGLNNCKSVLRPFESPVSPIG